MELEKIVPWGRNLQEYKEMGLFTQADTNKKILGCGDGPASVNAELRKMGVNIVSIDPIYAFSKEEIEKRVQETSHIVASELRAKKNEFVWKNIADVERLINLRLSAMRLFLEDYALHKDDGHYLHQELPTLAFKEASFDLAWSSHFLFLYSQHLSYEFHLNAILEMLRVAKELRIFPILQLNNEKSKHLKPLLAELEKRGFSTSIEKSNYEFQKGGFEMLRVEKNV